MRLDRKATSTPCSSPSVCALTPEGLARDQGYRCREQRGGVPGSAQRSDLLRGLQHPKRDREQRRSTPDAPARAFFWPSHAIRGHAEIVRIGPPAGASSDICRCGTGRGTHSSLIIFDNPGFANCHTQHSSRFLV